MKRAALFFSLSVMAFASHAKTPLQTITGTVTAMTEMPPFDAGFLAPYVEFQVRNKDQVKPVKLLILVLETTQKMPSLGAVCTVDYRFVARIADAIVIRNKKHWKNEALNDVNLVDDFTCLNDGKVSVQPDASWLKANGSSHNR